MADSGHSGLAAPSASVATAAGSRAEAGIEYTFDHATTVQIYNMIASGSTSGLNSLCQTVIPAPVGGTLCPMLASALPGMLLTPPQEGDRLHVAVQWGWPPLHVEYVK